MLVPAQRDPVDLGGGLFCLPAFMPVPGMGVLAANSFVIDGAEPVIVDTGIAPLADAFLTAVESVIDPARIRWIWLTHMDPDHLGGLPALLEAAPHARIATNFLGAGKLALLGLPAERAHLLSPGEELVAGERFMAIRPPYYDAPETMGLWDATSRTLFSADAFGALLPEPVDDAAAIVDDALHIGTARWTAIDAPWIADQDEGRFQRMLARFADLDAATILSAHLPPATGMAPALLANLAAVRYILAFPAEIGLPEAA